jgi:DedD protein
MENRLKERLTGAAILVALIVLLVPEIFRGQRDDAHPGSTGAGSEGAPLRSYTIDLSNKGSGPVQSTGDAVADSAVKAPPAPAPAPAPAVPAPALASPAPAAASPEPHLPDARVPDTHASSAEPRPATQTHAPPATRPAAAPAAHAARTEHPESGSSRASISQTAPAPSAAAGGGWSVQLGLFAKRENAERLSGEAHNKGFQTSISSDAKGQYRVRTSGVADRAAADSLAQRLKSAGYPAAVVAPSR